MSGAKTGPPMRRWALLAGALALAVTATVVVLGADGEEPEDVVRDYLALVQKREVERALDYTDQLPSFHATSAAFLTPEAIAGDWTVTRLVRRHHEDDDPATVDVTITAADGTAREGRFNLVENADGDWRILNPLVRLNTERLPADFLGLNGATGTGEEFWVFPGAYRVFPALSGIVSAPTYVAVPPSGDDRESGSGIPTEAYAPVLGAGPEQEAVLGEQFQAWLDACAATSSPNPVDCPFSAGHDDAAVSLPGGDLRTGKVTWTMQDEPRVRLKQGPDGLSLVTVTPGFMRVSGEGVPEYPAGAPKKKFSARCAIELDAVAVRLTPEGFAFTAREPYSATCLYPYF